MCSLAQLHKRHKLWVPDSSPENAQKQGVGGHTVSRGVLTARLGMSENRLFGGPLGQNRKPESLPVHV